MDTPTDGSDAGRPNDPCRKCGSPCWPRTGRTRIPELVSYRSIRFAECVNRTCPASGRRTRFHGEPALPSVLSLDFAGTYFALSAIAGSRNYALSTQPYERFSIAAAILFFGLGILQVHKYFARRNWHEFRDEDVLRDGLQPLEGQNYTGLLADTFDEQRQLSNAQLQIFLGAIVKPREFRQRVVESYRIEQRTLRQHISIEARVPASLWKLMGKKQRTEPIFFPVLLPSKGKMQDEFSLFDGSGSAVMAISYRDYLTLAVTSARLFIAYATGRMSLMLSPDDEADALLEATRLIMCRVDESGKPIGVLPTDGEWSTLSTGRDASEVATGARGELSAFVGRLTDHYAIVAAVTPDRDGRILVKVEQTLIPRVSLGSRRARLGVLLGAGPVELTLGVRNAFTAESYHLRVTAPDGLYLAKQEADGLAGCLDYDERKQSVPPHYRFRARLGQSYAHFYTRFLAEPKSPETTPQLRFSFYERLPGSTLPAASSAVATLVLVWIIAVTLSGRVDGSASASGWLLAFPALAASWLGLQAPTDRLLEGTLSARLSLLLTVCICVASSAIFLGHQVASAQMLSWWSLPPGLSLFWITDASFLGLFVAAAVNAGFILHRYLTRAAYYELLSCRKWDSDVTRTR